MDNKTPLVTFPSPTMLSSTSNIQAFVQWSEQTVFAGEEIDCQITFKNIAPLNEISLPPFPNAISNGMLPIGERQRNPEAGESLSAPTKKSTARTGATTRGRHRSTLSLNATTSKPRLQKGGGVFEKESARYHGSGTDERSHRRSISIISLGLSDRRRDEISSPPNVSSNFQRPSKGHTRSSSLQIIPRRAVTSEIVPLSASFPHRLITHSSPLVRTVLNPNERILHPNTDIRKLSTSHKQVPGTRSVPSTPSTHAQPFTKRKGSASFPHNFEFPITMLPHNQLPPADNIYDEKVVTQRKAQASDSSTSPNLKVDVLLVKDQVDPLAKILSTTTNGETPRNSAEFYSLSNNSAETLASEYVTQYPSRKQQYRVHARTNSNFAVVPKKIPETLMIGYAQIHGSFTLDGSLVNQAPFEEVKRKAVFGGQGGGVIGVETSRRDTGLLRGFGWGNIGESIGGLLSGGELSSIKDMRGIAGSKSVPLLTTPQSILFVDLRLFPGESKSYRYTFKLPKGLPPSYRGKAIKISYNLVIGTQRPGGAKEQQVRLVEVPFRVLGSVDEHGELLGHDFMLPYIIMRDQAKIQCLDSTPLVPSEFVTNLHKQKIIQKTDQVQTNLDDFLTYVDNLLAKPRQSSNMGILSPRGLKPRRLSSMAGPSSTREAIDLAILRSNRATDSRHIANRFEIARNGRRVAVVMLTRPAYRLGETITAAVDFTGADISCYALHASLETSERIENAIALRSNASIHRVTRRVYSSSSESTIFARRMIFSCNIPSTATPSFVTSGVSLEWYISMEFVTPRLDRLEVGGSMRSAELLEEVCTDERSIIFAAAEDVECESFEIAVPLQVYGALISSAEREDEYRGMFV